MAEEKIRWMPRVRGAAEPATGRSAEDSPPAEDLLEAAAAPAAAPAPAPPATPTGADITAEGGWRRSLRERWSLWLIIGLLALAVLAAFVRLQLGSANRAGAVTQQDIPIVSTVTPGLSAVTSSISFTGAVAARYDTAVGVEGEGGRIEAVYVEAGDRVKRGQVLATLDTSILGPQVTRLAASLEEARANARLAEAEARRAEAVAAAGTLSREEIERRRAAAVTAAARVDVAAAQLLEQQARLNRTELRAPSDGIVLSRNAEVGQAVTTGSNPIFRISRGGEVEVRAQVAEQDLPSIQAGQKASVRLSGVARPFEGTVRLVGPIIDPQTRLGSIRIELKPDPNLRPGAFARGDVVVGGAQRPVLPRTAVLSDDRGSYVMLVDAQSKVVKRYVKIAGTRPDGVVIDSGLAGTERVIGTAAGFVREGETVKLAGGTAAAGGAAAAGGNAAAGVPAAAGGGAAGGAAAP